MIDCRLQVLMAQMCLNHHQSQLIKSQHDVWWMAAIFATDVFEGRPFIRLLNNHRPTITKGMRSNQIGKHQYRHSWSEIRLMGLINCFYRFTIRQLKSSGLWWLPPLYVLFRSSEELLKKDQGITPIAHCYEYGRMDVESGRNHLNGVSEHSTRTKLTKVNLTTVNKPGLKYPSTWNASLATGRK